MKKRLLPIILAMILILTFIPFGPAAVASGEFTATLMGQLDSGVSDAVDEWGIGDLPEASVSFDLFKPATISMQFDEPIKFTGNWTGISTDVPVGNDEDAMRLGGQILSFVVDGDNLGSRVVPLIDRDEDGFLTIDIARQWGGDYDAYDLAGMDPFSTLEITFVVGHIAQLLGELEIHGDLEHGWAIGDAPGAIAPVQIGERSTISMNFNEPVKFSGNWTGIATTIQVADDDDAESTGAHITSFIVDGEDLGSKIVPLINRDDSGFMTIDIARQWGGDYDAYDLAGMDPFTSLEISFIVMNMPGGESGGGDDAVPDVIDFATSGNAWIGGTFLDEDGEFGWIPYEDQQTPFELGVPFTATLDFGSDTNTHGEASFGFITVVQTDIMDSAIWYDAYIDDILVDGSSISFNPNNIEVGFDGGVRVSLTNGWTENPVVAGVHVIGTFSKLEVVMAFVEADEPSPFGGSDTPEDTPEPPPPPPPIERPDTPDEPDVSDGLPGWVIPVIIAAVIVIGGVIVFIVMKNKKSGAAE
ncbi:MAG: hypothetical protein LBD23_07690 [Oscillospiraceae bacterium]|jgi:hypothetical protein|nr:hypothetical protein [Oscillospiraceae bacterium]